MSPAPSSLLFMAFLAVLLAIRGYFAQRMRRDKAVSRSSLFDRALIGLVGV